MDASEEGKRQAAEAAAALVEDGMVLGLGTGSTVAYFLPAVATRGPRVRCVATSLGTERAARTLGLVVEPFESLDRLDLAVDGADQVAPDRWLVKGGGGAHTRGKVVAAAARRFIVIASSDKLVSELAPPVALEILVFGAAATLAALAPAALRNVPAGPERNLI